MIFTLRPYQQEAADAAVTHFRDSVKLVNGLLVLPTASGKSLIIAEVARQLDEPILVLAPTRELLLQDYEKLTSYGIEGVVMHSASVKQRDIGRITVASIGSIERRPQDFKHYKYILCDEAHLIAPGGRYVKFLQAIGNPRVVGLTATPYRLVSATTTHTDGKRWNKTWLSLLTAPGQFFDTLLYVKNAGELTSEGYLAKATYHQASIGGLHTLKVNSSGTEFTDTSVSSYWSETAVDKLSTWLQSLDHARTLVFVPTLAMAAMMTPALGVDMIDGTMPARQREHILQRFKDGDTHILVNVGVLTTGYDLPALDAVVLARPTMSLGLALQMIGRVLRVDPREPTRVKHVYDFAGNVTRFGKAETVVVTADGVRANGRMITGEVISEVCISDIMARRKQREAVGA